ncbi:MAG: hypothetical protein GY756_14260, partial [bacterium]|nr:hypothetical protein [bacterium]
NNEKNNYLKQCKEFFTSGDLGNVKRCKKCLISGNFPGAKINENGICSFCDEFEEYKEEANLYFKGIPALEEIIKRVKEEDIEYDCMLLFSGGKDSSYVLYRLVELGLKVLAFTFDNGYISDTAFSNIKRITSKLGVDSLICNNDNMNQIFVESLHLDHTVGGRCFQALTTVSTKVAIDKGIKMVFTGLSRGQIFD